VGLPFEDVERIKKEFQEEYFFRESYLAYVNMCGISTVGINDKNTPTDQEKDFCIYVGLRKPLPPDLTLPEEYKGVRVLVKEIGGIRAEPT